MGQRIPASAKTSRSESLEVERAIAQSIAIHSGMAQRQMYASMGALRRSLGADVASVQACSSRALHSSARRLEEQPSDASPAQRTSSVLSIVRPRTAVLTQMQRQTRAKYAQPLLSSRLPRCNTAASPAHSQEVPSPAAKCYDEPPARPLLKPTNTASSPKMVLHPIPSKTPAPAPHATQQAQGQSAARPLHQAKWSAPPPHCV